VERAEPEDQVDGVNADHTPPGKELGEGLERLAVARDVEVGISTAASWSVMPARRSRFSRGVLDM